MNQNILFVLTGEDEVSFSRHTKALQTEFKKTHHNLQIVNELMSSSFALRRKDILEHPCGLKAVLEKYPFLRNPDQVHIMAEVNLGSQLKMLVSYSC